MKKLQILAILLSCTFAQLFASAQSVPSPCYSSSHDDNNGVIVSCHGVPNFTSFSYPLDCPRGIGSDCETSCEGGNLVKILWNSSDRHVLDNGSISQNSDGSWTVSVVNINGTGSSSSASCTVSYFPVAKPSESLSS